MRIIKPKGIDTALCLTARVLHKGETMAKASINFAKAAKGGLAHNDRSEDREPDYLLPAEYRLQNEVDRSAGEASKMISDLYTEARENYRQKFGQPLKAKSYVWEAVVNLNKEHTLEDVQRLTRAIEKETGFTGVQIAIHRDEGHINERGVPQYNLHAHITFFTLDRQTGQQLYRKGLTERQKRENPELKAMNRERLSKLQDLTAEVLGMERGKRGSKAVRLDHKAYKEAKRQELAKVKDLKQEIADLRQELKANGANREDYARLEAENKQLKEKIKAKDLTIEDLKEQIEDLRKDLRRDNAKDEKLEQYREIILDQEERIDALIEQNKALEAKISPKEGQSMANGSKIDLRMVAELNNGISFPGEEQLKWRAERLLSDYGSELLLKEFLDQEAEPITKGVLKKEVVGFKITMTQANSLYTRLREREQSVRGFIKDAKSVFNSLGKAADKVKDFFRKLQQPERDRSVKEFKAQSKTKDKSRSRGGMSR